MSASPSPPSPPSPPLSFPKAIIGLGNPGEKYTDNRHNIGFMIADRLAANYNGSAWKDFKDSLTAKIRLEDEEILLVKPQTYMNLSGGAVAKLMQFYKWKPQDLWVVHDELDLPFCEVRSKFGGGTAGHNGLKNLHDAIGDKFYRLRFGIGRPDSKDMVSPYVLSDFSATEQPIVEKSIADISHNIYSILSNAPTG